MSTTAEIRSGTNAPELFITPPARWWENPLRELWEYRELLYFFVWRDIKVRYKQTALGAAWAVLQPLLTMMMFSLFFGRLVHIPSDGLPYPVFYYTALLPWTYFSQALQTGTMGIVNNQHVITKVYFPRLTLPLSGVLSGLVDFAISFVILVAFLLYYGIHLTANLVFLAIFLLLAILTALAVSLWLSALNAIYRDVRYVVPFLIQFWMFASPLVYPSSLVPQQWRWLYDLNPLAAVIEGFRWSLTGHGKVAVYSTAISVTVVLLLLLSGMAYFRRMETTVADVI
jgi:lipopolysaccharide transport system permease protein